MKQVVNVLVILFLFSATSVAQSGNNYIPELVFQNPVLTSGMAGKDGAVYTFANVAKDIDATVTVKGRSSASVVLTNIDVENMGWKKAFQPQFGIPGNVPANQNWWMDFEIRFYKAGTTNKQKIKGFQVTALDVDGDGVSIQEYIQMNKVKTVAYCPVNYLIDAVPSTLTSLYDNEGNNSNGVDKKAQGPVQNFTNIDTSATPVMATYTYEDKDMIYFRYGARSGAVISNAGERLNSLWFKAFSLAPPSLLPIVFYNFTASYDKRNANLNWTAQGDENSSHFVVERSSDGRNFQPISKVALSGGATTYSFTDANVTDASGLVYYRIQSVEKTGEVNYSSVKMIRLSKETAATLSVYPNPVQRAANLTLPAAWQTKTVNISIYNGAGMLVKAISVRSASQTETLDLSQLSRGIYVVKAQCSDEWAEQRILRN